MIYKHFLRLEIFRRHSINFLWASQCLKKLDLLKTPHFGCSVTLLFFTFFHKNFFDGKANTWSLGNWRGDIPNSFCALFRKQLTYPWNTKNWIRVVVICSYQINKCCTSNIFIKNS
jgi:hypothetical protein